MDQLEQLLRSVTPDQIEQAVQLLQRYSGTAQQECVRVGDEGRDNEGAKSKAGVKHTDSGVRTKTVKGDNGARDRTAGSSSALNSDPDVCPVTEEQKALAAAVALALQRGTDFPASKANEIVLDEELSEDVPLVVLVQAQQRAAAKRGSTHLQGGDKQLTIDEDIVDETEGVVERKQKAKNSQKSPEKRALQKNNSNASPVATAVRGLTCFGFVRETKKTTTSADAANRLFMPFVQDKRIVPSALQFWEHERSQNVQSSTETGEVFILDDSSVPQSAPKPLSDKKGSCNKTEKVAQIGESRSSSETEALPASFTAMIETATTSAVRSKCCTSGGGGSDVPTLAHCPCDFHVNLMAPRPGFCNEVIFCGFYAVGYDPCQSRPPYFGTYNSQDALSTQELLQLARFGVGSEMPRSSNLDYDYDSGDDWDVVEGDEDLGASSSGSDSSEEDDNGSGSDADKEAGDDSDDDFINDNDEYEDDSDAEIQRRMMESRQRRLNRLRQKDKLIPAFSGPFVGVAVLDHPMREYDQLERISSRLDGATFSALIQQCLRSCNNTVDASLASERDDVHEGVECIDECGTTEEDKQRLVAAALRNRRDMLPEELDALHAIVSANAKISPKNIVHLLQQQQWCVGVAQAEIHRTIRRFYDRKHNTLVRRSHPWSATDERLFAKPAQRKADAEGGAHLDTNDEDDEDQAASVPPKCSTAVRNEHLDENETIMEAVLKRVRTENS